MLFLIFHTAIFFKYFFEWRVCAWCVFCKFKVWSFMYYPTLAREFQGFRVRGKFVWYELLCTDIWSVYFTIHCMLTSRFFDWSHKISSAVARIQCLETHDHSSWSFYAVLIVYVCKCCISKKLHCASVAAESNIYYSDHWWLQAHLLDLPLPYVELAQPIKFYTTWAWLIVIILDQCFTFSTPGDRLNIRCRLASIVIPMVGGMSPDSITGTNYSPGAVSLSHVTGTHLKIGYL